MVQVPVYNTNGEKVEALELDEATLGGTVNAPLLKQAVVAYEARRHQGTVRTKGRSDVAGSTRKLFRQKGTGRARRGNIRTPVLRGGGHTFAKRNRPQADQLPRKMRRAALNSAILAKILGENLLVVQGLSADAPKTKWLAGVLAKLGISRSCLLALDAPNRELYLSGRNIPGLTIRAAADLNAYEVATRRTLLVTAEAMDALLGQEATA